MLRPDPELEAKMDSLIDIIGRAQQKDGYLFVCHTCGCFDPFWVGDKPYSRLRQLIIRPRANELSWI